jgi:xylulokinase
MSLLGLDIGTSGCKAGIFDEDGNMVEFAYQEYSLYFPEEGLIEIVIENVRDSVIAVIGRVCEKVSRDDISAIGITSLGDVIVAIDSDGNAVHNAIVDIDPRGKNECQRLIDVLGVNRIYEITGIPPVWMNSICKIMWLQENIPEICEKTWKYLCFEDLAIMWLGAEPAIDYSLASRTMAFDLSDKIWSDEILSVARLTPNAFAGIYPSGHVIGAVDKRAADEFGLEAGIPIVSGAHDWICAMLAAGVISEDKIVADVTGTMEGILVACEEPLIEDHALKAGYSTYCHALPDMYVLMGFLSTAGILLRWYRDNLSDGEWEAARNQHRDVYDIIIEHALRGKHRMMVVPHFAGCGTPYFDPIQTGAIIGLTLDVSTNDIAKGILEGLAFELRLNLNHFAELGREIDEIRAVGGGSKSHRWLQLKADITGREVKAPLIHEASCKGAALLAGYATGVFASMEEGVRCWLKDWITFKPRLSLQENYDRRYAQYLRVRDYVKALNQSLGAT